MISYNDEFGAEFPWETNWKDDDYVLMTKTVLILFMEINQNGLTMTSAPMDSLRQCYTDIQPTPENQPSLNHQLI